MTRTLHALKIIKGNNSHLQILSIEFVSKNESEKSFAKDVRIIYIYNMLNSVVDNSFENGMCIKYARNENSVKRLGKKHRYTCI